jgi:predicted DCC family thiol-disulfide oxidoreductase YuxK
MSLSRRHRIIFDDDCGLCTAAVRWLVRLDWLGALQLVPASQVRDGSVDLPVAPQALEAAIHCVTVDGRVLVGIGALRFIGLRLPLVVPLALLLWVPGIAWLARRGYSRVSRHRQTLSRWLGCRTACTRRVK